jgi:NADH-quinone oxidoreductase subunit N
MMMTSASALATFVYAHSFPALLAQLQTSLSLSQAVPQGADYMRILPELVLSIFGMLIMVVDPLLDDDTSHNVLGTIALVGGLAALASTFWMAQYPGTAFWNMVRVEGFSVFFHVLVIAIAVVAILSSFEYLKVQRIRAGEYYGLILFGTVGMCLMSSAIELVLIFIALEISSISTYVLAGFRRRDAASSESSLKYFLLGSFATAFFLYGVALMFGATGSTNIDAISAALHYGAGAVPVLAYVATALMFVGAGSSGRADVDGTEGSGLRRFVAGTV